MRQVNPNDACAPKVMTLGYRYTYQESKKCYEERARQNQITVKIHLARDG